MSFTITGIKSLDKKLKTLEPRLAKKVLRKALRKAAKLVKQEVQSTAPVDSGALKSSVKVRAAKRSRNSVGVNVQIGEGDFKGETWYAAVVEYGSSKQRGQGYMRRAFDAKKEEALGVIVDEIRSGVERDSRRIL